MARVYFDIPDDHLLLGGVIVVETLGEEGKEITVKTLHNASIWSQIGYLQAGLDRQREVMKRMWR